MSHQTRVNPHRHDDPLIQAATRHVSEQCGLDLSRCTKWVRVCELHYQRSGALKVVSSETATAPSVDSTLAIVESGSGTVASQGARPVLGGGEFQDVVVLWVVDVDACVPSAEEWPLIAEQQAASKSALQVRDAASKKKVSVVWCAAGQTVRAGAFKISTRVWGWVMRRRPWPAKH